MQMRDAQALEAKLSEAHVNALKSSVSTTFESICGAQPKFLGEIGKDVACTGAVGIIALIGDLSWSLAMGLPRETAISLAEKFAGFPIDYESSDMADVVGELANIISGDLVARLEGIGCRVRMGLPSVIRGDALTHKTAHAQEATRLRFGLAQGEIWVGLALAPPQPR